MWAAAPVSRGFKARVDRLKLSRSYGYSSKFCFDGMPYMSQYISTVICNVQERLLEAGPNAIGFSPGALGSDINLRV